MQMYRIDAKQKFGYRKVNFKEAYDYDEKKSFKLLQYVTLILRIFNLQYIMGRNTLPAQQILEMENSVRIGKEFWNKIAAKQE